MGRRGLIGLIAGLALGAGFMAWWSSPIPLPRPQASEKVLGAVPVMPLPALPVVAVEAPPAGSPALLPPLPVDVLPPLPPLLEVATPDGGVVLPMISPVETVLVETPPAPMPPTSPRHAARILSGARQVPGVRSLAWGEGAQLYVIVEGAKASAVANTICARWGRLNDRLFVVVQESNLSAGKFVTVERSCG